MWRYWTRRTRCAGLCAPNPPSPASLGKAGCLLPTWTSGSRYLDGWKGGPGVVPPFPMKAGALPWKDRLVLKLSMTLSCLSPAVT